MHAKRLNCISWAPWAAGLGTTILIVLFLVWRQHNPDTSTAGRIGALASAVLFEVLGVRFLFHWQKQWGQQQTADARLSLPLRKRDVLGVFLALLGVEAATVLLMFVLQVMDGCREPLKEALELWTKVDSQHYLDIAEEWYLSEGDWGRIVQLVFLPGYPLVVRLFSSLTKEYLHTAMLVSALSFAGGGTVLYCLTRLDGDHETALRAVKYICLLPGAFFFAAPMSESLFFLLSVSCVYCGRKGHWLPAGLLGMLAAFTRSLGLMLVIPVCFDFLEHLLPPGKKHLGKIIASGLCLFLIPLGFLAYCAICKDISGEWFKFMEYQNVHWHQSLGLFFNTASYQIEYAIDDFRNLDYEGMMGLWIPNLFCSLFSLVVMILSVRRQHAGYTAYFIGYFVIAIGATWLLSAPRYLLVLFPVSIGLADLTENRSVDSFATALLAIISTLYMFMFVWRWQVW